MKKILFPTFVLILCISCDSKTEGPQIQDLDFSYVNYVDSEHKGTLNILRRNIIILDFSAGECVLEGTKVNDSLICPKIKRMLKSGKRHDPILDSAKFQLAGDVLVPNYVLSASYPPELDYRKYSFWRSEIFRAINELREEFAEERFQKNYWELLDSKGILDRNMLREIQIIYPLRYSEYVMD